MRCSTCIWAGATVGAIGPRPRNERNWRMNERANGDRPKSDRPKSDRPKSDRPKRVLVTGGAGYVGSNLVPKLLAAGYEVSVLDLYIYGQEIFSDLRSNPRLVEIKGDL